MEINTIVQTNKGAIEVLLNKKENEAYTSEEIMEIKKYRGWEEMRCKMSKEEGDKESRILKVWNYLKGIGGNKGESCKAFLEELKDEIFYSCSLPEGLVETLLNSLKRAGVKREKAIVASEDARRWISSLEGYVPSVLVYEKGLVNYMFLKGLFAWGENGKRLLRRDLLEIDVTTEEVAETDLVLLHMRGARREEGPFCLIKGLELLKEKGLLVCVLPSTFLSDPKNEKHRELAFKSSRLVSAFTFPSGFWVSDTIEESLDLLVLEKCTEGFPEKGDKGVCVIRMEGTFEEKKGELEELLTKHLEGAFLPNVEIKEEGEEEKASEGIPLAPEEEKKEEIEEGAKAEPKEGKVEVGGLSPSFSFGDLVSFSLKRKNAVIKGEGLYRGRGDKEVYLEIPSGEDLCSVIAVPNEGVVFKERSLFGVAEEWLPLVPTVQELKYIFPSEAIAFSCFQEKRASGEVLFELWVLAITRSEEKPVAIALAKTAKGYRVGEVEQEDIKNMVLIRDFTPQRVSNLIPEAKASLLKVESSWGVVRVADSKDE